MGMPFTIFPFFTAASTVRIAFLRVYSVMVSSVIFMSCGLGRTMLGSSLPISTRLAIKSHRPTFGPMSQSLNTHMIASWFCVNRILSCSISIFMVPLGTPISSSNAFNNLAISNASCGVSIFGI